MVRGLIYDVGAIHDAACGEEVLWQLHKATLARGVLPAVPSVVISEARRYHEPRLMVELLEACDVVTLGESEAYLAGCMLRSDSSLRPEDAVVTARALFRGELVVTTRPGRFDDLFESIGVEMAAISVTR